MADHPHSDETETELVQRAQAAVSHCNWEVGLCAAQWTKRYARGRTDADFAAMVGLSADQVFQRRRVAETFGQAHEKHPALKWSHFYSALNWDDAGDCLQWAAENQATVSEMKAWRRASRGEDLTEAPRDEFAGDPAILQISGEPAVVADPGETAPTVSAALREDGDEYAPYRSGVGSPAPADVDAATTVATAEPRPSALRIVKRATKALEGINAALTPGVIEEIKGLPRKVCDPFTTAVAELSTKAAGLL
ncbi:MAG: hypothetical protein ACE5KM_16595 [Planctomycetaceae bacterium]